MIYILTPETLDTFVRAFVEHIDYDIHKNYECGEEDGLDHYPELVEEAAEMLPYITETEGMVSWVLQVRRHDEEKWRPHTTDVKSYEVVVALRDECRRVCPDYRYRLMRCVAVLVEEPDDGA